MKTMLKRVILLCLIVVMIIPINCFAINFVDKNEYKMDEGFNFDYTQILNSLYAFCELNKDTNKDMHFTFTVYKPENINQGEFTSYIFTDITSILNSTFSDLAHIAGQYQYYTNASGAYSGKFVFNIDITFPEKPKELDKYIDSFLDEVRGKSYSDYDLILKFYEYLSKKGYTYDTTFAEDLEGNKSLDSLYGDVLDRTALSANGVFTTKKGVCEGYSNLVQYFCDRVGIPCIKMSSEEYNSIGHAWNIFYLDSIEKIKLDNKKNINYLYSYYDMSDVTNAEKMVISYKDDGKEKVEYVPDFFYNSDIMNSFLNTLPYPILMPLQDNTFYLNSYFPKAQNRIFPERYFTKAWNLKYEWKDGGWAKKDLRSVFTDIKGHWAENEILMTYVEGRVNGFGDGRFGPNDTVTLAQFLTIMCREEAEKEKSNGTLSYSSDTWWSAYYNFALKHNILMESMFPTERANTPISREEMVYLLSNYYRYKNFKTENQKNVDIQGLADFNEIDARYRANVQYAYVNGLISGKGDNLFCPKDTLTRAEACTVLYRVYHTK